MQKNIYEKQIKIKYSEMSYDMSLKPSALLQILEDMASENADNLDFGYNFVRKNNLAWVLLKYHMEFEKYPQNLNSLTIKTEPRGYNKLFAFRDFYIESKDQTLGRIASTWSLIDMNTRNLMPAQQILPENKNMFPFVKREDDMLYTKIRPLTKIDIEKTFEIRYDDIDVNKHANNANYIVWAFEPLDFEFRSKNRLKTLDLVFKKEIQYGNDVLSQIEIIDNTTNHVLKSAKTGEELCCICAQWVNI